MNYCRAKSKVKYLHEFNVILLFLSNCDHLTKGSLIARKSIFVLLAHWLMFSYEENILKWKELATKNPYSQVLVSVIALMENQLHVLEIYFSKHWHCTHWSFNWFSQHSSLCTQVLIATSNCSNAWIVEKTINLGFTQSTGERQREKPAWRKTQPLFSSIRERICREMH
jgi:hypothetical protein